MMKKILLTLSIVLATPASNLFANSEIDFGEDAPELKTQTWSQWAMTQGSETVNKVLSASGDKLIETAVGTAKYLAALNLNYYSVNALEELTAYGIYAGASLVAGPVAGNSAYYATKGGLKVARWIVPGFESVLATTYAPLTKTLIIDPVVSNAPAIGKASLSAASTAASYLKEACTSAYTYFWGGVKVAEDEGE